MLILLDQIRTVILDTKIVPELVENLKLENLEPTNSSKVPKKNSRNPEHTDSPKVREKCLRTLCELAQHGNPLQA